MSRSTNENTGASDLEPQLVRWERALEAVELARVRYGAPHAAEAAIACVLVWLGIDRALEGRAFVPATVRSDIETLRSIQAEELEAGGAALRAAVRRLVQDDHQQVAGDRRRFENALERFTHVQRHASDPGLKDELQENAESALDDLCRSAQRYDSRRRAARVIGVRDHGLPSIPYAQLHGWASRLHYAKQTTRVDPAAKHHPGIPLPGMGDRIPYEGVQHRPNPHPVIGRRRRSGR